LHLTNKWAIIAALVLALCIGSAAVAEGSYYQSLPVEGLEHSMKITVDVPEENPVEDNVNPLTGEPWYDYYYPILVNIDSHPDALPHWGVSSADIMYEMPVQQDGSTRSVALFMGEVPSFAGPVRSGRVPHASLREMWDGAWVFYGWQNWYTNAENLVVDVIDWALHLHPEARGKGRWVYPFIEGTGMNHASLFHRESDGMHVAPHNVQVDVQAVRSLFTEESTKHPFKFSKTGFDRGVDVSDITIEYKTTKPAYISKYVYNEVTGLYDRYRNGEAYYDALNGMTTSYANVIVLRTDVSWYNNAPSVR